MKRIFKFIPTLMCLIIFGMCLYLFFFDKNTIKLKEADYEVMSISFDEIKDLLELATLEIPFSDYETRTVNPKWKIFSPIDYDRYLYIERGLLTLGVDLKDESTSLNINEKNKKINIIIPDVKILRYTRFTDKKNPPCCELYLVKNGFLTSSSYEKIKKIDLEVSKTIENRVKEKYFTDDYKDLARNSAKEYIKNMLNEFYPAYDVNIDVLRADEVSSNAE